MAIAHAAGLRRMRAAKTPWYWWLFRIALVGTVLLTITVVVAWFYFTEPSRVRRLVQSLLQEQLNGKVELDDASLTLSRGLQLYDLRILSPPDERQAPRTVAHVREIQIKPDWGAMLDGLVNLNFRPVFEKIVVIRPTFVLHFDSTGRFADEDLVKPQPEQADDGAEPWIALPPIEIRQAVLRWKHPVIFNEAEHRLDNLSLQLTPSPRRGWLDVHGVAEGEPLGRFEFGGVIHAYRFETRLEMVNHNLLLDDRVMRHFAGDIFKAYREFVPDELKGGARAELAARVDLRPGKPAGFALDVTVLDGAIAFHQFPVPVHSVVGCIQLTNYEPRDPLPPFQANFDFADDPDRPVPNSQTGLWVNVALRGAYGRSGDVSLHARIETGTGYENIHVSARDVLVDEEFRRAIDRSRTVAEEVKEIFRLFTPGGVADGEFVSLARAGQSKPDQNLHLWLHDVHSLFRLFPLPAYKIEGEIQGWDAVWNVPWSSLFPQGPGGSMSLRFRGPTYMQNDDLQLDIQVTAPDVLITPTLKRALPDFVRTMIDEYGVSGTIDLTSAVVETRPGAEAGENDLLLSLDIRPKQTLVEWTHLPWPVLCDGGLLRVREGRIDFVDVTGTHGDARITINGHVDTPPGGGEPIISLDFHCERIAFDDELWAAIEAPPRPGTLTDGPAKEPLLVVRDMFQPEGLLDVDLRMRGAEQPSMKIDVWFHGDAAHPAAVNYDLSMGDPGAPPYRIRLTDVTGRVTVTLIEQSVHVQFSGVRGVFAGATVTVEGMLQTGSNGVPHTALVLEATDLTLTEPVERAFRYFEDFSWRWQRDPAGQLLLGMHGEPVVVVDADGNATPRMKDILDPTGTLDLRVELMPAADGSGLQPVIAATLRGMSVKLQQVFPWRLDDVRGRVNMEGGVIRLAGITARHNDSRILVPEAILTTFVRGYQFRLVAHDMAWNQELRDALPAEAWKTLYDTMDPFGRFSMAMSVDARMHASDSDKMIVSYDLELHTDGDDINVGPIRAELVRGHLRMRGLVQADGTHNAHGRMRIDEAQWRNMKLHGLTADLQITQDQEVTHLLVPRAFGALYGGFLETRFEMDAIPGGDYSGYIRFTGFDAGRWLREVYPGSARLEGVTDAELTINGRLGHDADNDGEDDGDGSFQGVGKFDVVDAAIFDVPLVLKLFDFSNYNQPTPVNEVHGEFVMLDQFMYFSRLDMFSDAVGFYGKGRMDYDMNMDMQFGIDFAPRFQGLPVPLRALVQLVERTLLPVFVKGPISNPIISAVFSETPTGADKVPDGIKQYPRGMPEYDRFCNLLREIVSPDHRALQADSVTEAVGRLSASERQRARLLMEERRANAHSGLREMLAQFRRLLDE